MRKRKKEFILCSFKKDSTTCDHQPTAQHINMYCRPTTHKIYLYLLRTNQYQTALYAWLAGWRAGLLAASLHARQTTNNKRYKYSFDPPFAPLRPQSQTLASPQLHSDPWRTRSHAFKGFTGSSLL
ncbi:unnamed protein product [Ceratitis capitata]|uniref:(Mediterranean fruit fly) hypothetical protein n=1 Tax=Ceratitis capitata TaxID=7213 RepID=A0A811U5W4_CERCA|nr:unnamed protein product [Ceratitis capitata]